VEKKANSKAGSTPLPDRRQVLLIGAASALMFAEMGTQWGRAAFAQKLVQKATSPIFTPEETEGPYWVDEKLKRSDLRIDPADKTLQKGLPLTLNIKISALQNGVIAPLRGAYIDLWHCNAVGVYSDVFMQNTVGRKFLRGYQVTDDKGQAQFTTVYPGWYQGRTVHIHARVRTVSDSKTTHDFTTQFYFDDAVTAHVYKQAPYASRLNRDTLNTTDGIYNGPARSGKATRPGGELLMLKLTEDSRHAVGNFDMLLDLASIPAQSRGGRGFGGPPPGGRPGGPPPFGGPPPGGPPPGGPPPGGPPPGGPPPEDPRFG
jgi:protocatechuate 3,4-dioxygenase beta subunit